jgi:hypothetical protein
MSPDLIDAFADYCKDSGQSPAKVLAELAAHLMLLDDNDPMYVWGVEFGEELNKAMKEGEIAWNT